MGVLNEKRCKKREGSKGNRRFPLKKGRDQKGTVGSL